MSFLWTKQNTERVLCDIELIRRVYDVISRYRYHVQSIYVLLDKVSLRAQKSPQYNENVIEVVLLRPLPIISLSTQ